MNRQSRASCYSLGLHLAVATLLLTMSTGIAPHTKPITIDLSIMDLARTVGPDQSMVQPRFKRPSVLVDRAGQPKPVKQPLSPTEMAVKMPTPQVEQVEVREDQVPLATRTHPSPCPCPACSAATSVKNLPGTGVGGVSAATAPIGRPSQAQVSAAGAKARYLKEHFAGIRDAILQRLVYPVMARRMGWAGTVKMAFVVSEDGCVTDVRVVTSSGFEVLDRNAAETIRRCSPYPKPPITAEVIIPVTYRLD